MNRSFEHWVPIHIFHRGPEPAVLWSHLGGQRFDDPFFTQTVTTALQSPLAKLLQRTTSLDELVAVAEREPAVEPIGFIFHVSRCGSTLVSQMFARLPRLIAISEAQPLMAVADDPHLSPTDRRRAFRALVQLYGRRVSGAEIGAVFKFGLREVFHWRMIAEIFPQVPRIVLHRDPVEVLVSNFAQPCEAALPGVIAPALLGTPPQPIATSEDYAAFVFSRIYACAVEAARAPGSLTVDYRDLPTAVASRIAPHFGIALSDDDRSAMGEATRLHAKDASRSTEFTPDSADKQAGASASLRSFCRTVIEPFYEQLQRVSRPFDNPLAETMATFLRSIGLTVEHGTLDSAAFLPGLALEAGRILIDEAKLLYPGDILHEAGHLAITPAAERSAGGGNLAAGGGEEMAAIAWSYAAALHLGLDPAVVFHPHGYRRGSGSLLENFRAGRFLAVPYLQWMGLTCDAAEAAARECAPYPHMIRWLRE